MFGVDLQVGSTSRPSTRLPTSPRCGHIDLNRHLAQTSSGPKTTNGQEESATKGGMGYY